VIVALYTPVQSHVCTRARTRTQRRVQTLPCNVHSHSLFRYAIFSLLRGPERVTDPRTAALGAALLGKGFTDDAPPSGGAWPGDIFQASCTRDATHGCLCACVLACVRACLCACVLVCLCACDCALVHAADTRAIIVRCSLNPLDAVFASALARRWVAFLFWVLETRASTRTDQSMQETTPTSTTLSQLPSV
jgi:hypothetical protein